MGLDTRISWSDNTINFWLGCHATTNPGCRECYATQRRLLAMGEAPHQVRRTAEATWHQATKWQTRLQETGGVETVFTCSLSDFFHPHADEWREDAWKIIQDTPNLQWIILTQRIEGVPSRLPCDWGTGYRNVWLGVSASDQAHADKRIPKLLAIPAALHLVSLEPLLEQVVLRDEWMDTLKWVITGGLSGDAWERHRLYPSWVRGLRDTCVGHEVAFHFKQLGGPATNYRDGDQAILDGQVWKQVPAATCHPVHQEQQLTLF